MIYTVKYRKIGSRFWKTVKRVKGDCLIQNDTIRVIVGEDESHLELRLDHYDFWFCPKRYAVISSNIKKETGVSV